MPVEKVKRLVCLILAAALGAVALCPRSAAQGSFREIIASGTGFIVSSDGYVLTNAHVVAGPTRITVTVGQTAYQTRVVSSDQTRDLALLKLVRPVGATGLSPIQGLPTVVIGDAARLSVGDKVYAIGCPDEICGTVTTGAVANLNVRDNQFIMTDLTIAHGNSGGPLLNGRGQVVGITSQGLAQQQASGQTEMTGFSFSIPINQAIPLLTAERVAVQARSGQVSGKDLSVAEVLSTVGPGVVYIEAAQLIPLPAFLPDNLLDLPLKGPTSYWADESRSWQEARSVVESSGARIEEASFGTYSSSESPKIDIVVGVLDLETEEEARKAAEVLSDPVVTLHKFGPPDKSGDIVFCASTGKGGLCAPDEPGTAHVEHYALLLQDSEPFESGAESITVRFMARNRLTASKPSTSSLLWPWSPTPSKPIPSVTTSVTGEEVGFLGAATIAIYDVVFFVRFLFTESAQAALTDCTLDSSNCVACSGVSFPNMKANDFTDCLSSIIATVIDTIRTARQQP